MPLYTLQKLEQYSAYTSFTELNVANTITGSISFNNLHEVYSKVVTTNGMQRDKIASHFLLVSTKPSHSLNNKYNIAQSHNHHSKGKVRNGCLRFLDLDSKSCPATRRADEIYEVRVEKCINALQCSM